jgi:hypothetical protein
MSAFAASSSVGSKVVRIQGGDDEPASAAGDEIAALHWAIENFRNNAHNLKAPTVMIPTAIQLTSSPM